MGFEQIKDMVSTNEGFMLVIMTCLWSKKTITRWVSFPYYRFYIAERKDPITPLFAMLSHKTCDLEPIHTGSFNNIVFEKIWRQHDSVFQNKLAMVRETGEFKFSNTIPIKNLGTNLKN